MVFAEIVLACECCILYIKKTLKGVLKVNCVISFAETGSNRFPGHAPYLSLVSLADIPAHKSHPLVKSEFYLTILFSRTCELTLFRIVRCKKLAVLRYKVQF